jgi:hypothetical protein
MGLGDVALQRDSAFGGVQGDGNVGIALGDVYACQANGVVGGLKFGGRRVCDGNALQSHA